MLRIDSGTAKDIRAFRRNGNRRNPWLLSAISLAQKTWIDLAAATRPRESRPFAWLLTLHPTAAGRIYAAYGGVYIGVAITGMAIIVLGPRSS